MFANPICAISVFISLTETQSTPQWHHIALVTGVSVTIVLFLTMLLGESLLRFFGIRLASFRVGGGTDLDDGDHYDARAQECGTRHTSEEAAEAKIKIMLGSCRLASRLRFCCLQCHRCGSRSGRCHPYCAGPIGDQRSGVPSTHHPSRA